MNTWPLNKTVEEVLQVLNAEVQTNKNEYFVSSRKLNKTRILKLNGLQKFRNNDTDQAPRLFTVIPSELYLSSTRIQNKENPFCVQHPLPEMSSSYRNYSI